MPSTDNTEPVRGLLQAIRDALDVPQPAALEDWELRQARVLAARCAYVRGRLEGLLEHGLTGQRLHSAAAGISAESAVPLPYEPMRRDGTEGDGGD